MRLQREERPLLSSAIFPFKHPQLLLSATLLETAPHAASSGRAISPLTNCPLFITYDIGYKYSRTDRLFWRDFHPRRA